MGKMKELYEAMDKGNVEEIAEILQREEYMRNLDETITDLACEYQAMIGGDHHKDRDCHWSITRRWSYGEDGGWILEHYGYLYEKLEMFFESYEEAQEALIDHLMAAINQMKMTNESYDSLGV
jgi:hypothetical protein